MAKGISIHVGLNEVDPGHYSGWPGTLSFCVADAEAMSGLASENGFDPQLLANGDATRAGLSEAIGQAASELQSGDMLFLSYAGHGGQVRDLNGDESDGVDETWCLYDGQLLDDEIERWWPTFSEGVRILVVSDSCHSGTITRLGEDESSDQDEADTTPRYMPGQVARSVYSEHMGFYKELQKGLRGRPKSDHTSVLLLAACLDHQKACEENGHGVFTSALCAALASGDDDDTYEKLHQRISRLMPTRQRPNLLQTGGTTFADEPPLRI